jgi:hypothetical protein
LAVLGIRGRDDDWRGLVGANDHRTGTYAGSIGFGDGNCGFCYPTYVVSMVEKTRIEGWSFAAKYIVGTVIGALVFVVAPETARWLQGGALAQDGMPKKGDLIGGFGFGMPRSGEMPKAGDMLGGIGAGPPSNGPAQTLSPPPASATGASSNYSIGEIRDNHGIIQQGPNNSVNLAPQPELRGIQSDQIANADGTFTHRYLVEWTAEFPGDWRIKAFGDGVLGVSTSAQQFGYSGVRDDHAFTTVNRPNGRYTILVQTKSNTKVELKNELIR